VHRGETGWRGKEYDDGETASEVLGLLEILVGYDIEVMEIPGTGASFELDTDLVDG
jgi:hypothetical protein